MTWTVERQLEVLLRLPWTIVATDEEGERVLRVREIPSVLASGTDAAEVERDFWESLRESLAAYLHFGDPVPKPKGVRAFPWEPGYVNKAPQPRFVLRIAPGGQNEVNEVLPHTGSAARDSTALTLTRQ
jgi:hypothetical protein